jgi:hypothetical protein
VEAFFPLRATTTEAGPTRDCARSSIRKRLVQPGSRLLMSIAPAAARKIATAPKTTDRIR